MDGLRRFRRWMRVVMPRGEFGALFLFALLGIESIGLWFFLQQIPVDEDFARFRICWLAGGGLAYGLYRAFAFHPLTNEDYRRWLELTPWNVSQPLPAGPVWLVPQDLVVILALIALNHELTWQNAVIPMCMLLGFLVGNLCLNWATGEWALSAAMAFALAGLPLLHRQLEYVLPVQLGCLGLSYWATRRSLQRFPWDVSQGLHAQLNKSPTEILQPQQLGWPYDLLAPTVPKLRITFHDGACISLLLGWLEFALMTMLSQLPNPPDRAVTLFFTFPGLFAGLGAIIVTTSNYPSPIDLWGRFWTLRWIIPAHDVLPATYLAAALVTVLLHATFQIWAGALGTAVTFLILLVFSPKVDEWRLTAPHRLRFVKSSQEFIQLP